MTVKKFPSILYEPEDDVLNIWLSKKPIDDSEDENGMIVHYTKNREPVYIEILFAKRFFRRDKKTDMPKNILTQLRVSLLTRLSF